MNRYLTWLIGIGFLGLGLAIVKAIVTAHGGHAEVQSAGEGKGSTFSIRLPVIPSIRMDE